MNTNYTPQSFTSNESSNNNLFGTIQFVKSLIQLTKKVLML